MGEPFIVEKPDRAEAQAEKFRAYIETPVLTGIDIDFPGFDAFDVEPKTIPDVMAERPIIVFGKYRGKASGAITVRGWSGSGKHSEAVKVADFSPDAKNSALRYLWARHRIQLLADYNNLFADSARIKEVTRLGLKYNLLTQYTSFVAIDQKVRNVGGKQEVVEQPLPMPEGVSDYAIGGGASVGYAGMGKAAAPVMRSMKSRSSAELSRDGAMWASPPPPAPMLAPATVQVGRLQVNGGLSQKSVKEVIEKKLGDLQAAYVAELVSNPVLAGKLVVEFTIQPDGTVRDAKATLNELNATIERKVLEVLKKLKFSRPSGSEATVRVTFNFKP
jgi:Ca-activated chloride channel family protein